MLENFQCITSWKNLSFWSFTVFVALSILFASQTAFAQQAGSLDTNFGTSGKVQTNVGISDGASALVVQPDEKILVAATVAAGASSSQFTLLRYKPNGTLDAAFGNNGVAATQMGETESQSHGVALQPDGKIIVAGQSDRTVNDYLQWGFALARYNTDGSLDTAFGNNGKVITDFGDDQTEYAQAVVVQPDGKIIAAGYRTPTAANFSIVLSRYNSDGSLDASFGDGGKAVVQCSYICALFDLEILNDGKLVASGDYASTSGGKIDAVLFRFNSDGSLDNTFDADGRATFAFGNNSDYAFSLAIQPDGKIVTAGYTRITQFNFDFALARFNTDGSLDTTFDGDGKVTTSFGAGRDDASAIIIQRDGKIVTAGESENGTAKLDFALVRYNSDGSVDSSFGVGGKVLTNFGTNTDDFSTALAIQLDGKLIAAGSTSPSPIGNSDIALARYNNDVSNRNRPPAFDFDGDGKTDISVFRPDTGILYLNRSRDGYTGYQFGVASDKLVPADYDGDGKTDAAVYRNGYWFVLKSSGLTFAAFNFGISSDIPAPADYDGDGRAELAVYRPSEGVWFQFNTVNNKVTAAQFGTSEDKPVAADYDGDGRADIAVFRSSSGTWYLQRSRDGYTGYQFGISSDKIVPADYDGDGKTDLAVYRPSEATWYILKSNGLRFAALHFGTATDMPAPADYDGDGQADIAVFRSSSGTWYLQQSANGFTAMQFGISTDKPVPNAFVP